MSSPPPHLCEDEGRGDPVVLLRASPELKEDVSSFQRFAAARVLKEDVSSFQRAHPVRSSLLRRPLTFY